MFLYSRSSQYALRALSYLVKNPESPVLTETIADQEDIPKSFLSKIMQDLVRAKILSSARGRKGGFKLIRDPKATTIYEVIDVFDDLESMMKVCAIGWEKCSDDNPCDLHHKYKALREQVKKYFQEVNLAEFAEVTVDKEKREKSVVFSRNQNLPPA